MERSRASRMASWRAPCATFDPSSSLT
jgi:hypothetical protein